MVVLGLARRSRRAGLLALLLSATVAAPAAGQSLTDRGAIEMPLPPGFGDLSALACGVGEVAYARSWQGNVAALREDGWVALPSVPGGDVGSNLGVEDDAVFTTVRGGIARYAGGAWSRIDAPIGRLYTTQIAAFGGHAIAAGRGRVVAWSGTAYAAYDAGTWRDLMAVWGQSETDLWVAGARGGAFYFDGRTMTAHPIPTEGTVTRLDGRNTRDVWAVVERPAGVFHWDGTEWSDRTAGLPGPASVVRVGHYPFAAGAFGLSRWDGHAWVHDGDLPTPAPGFVDLCFNTYSIIIGAGDRTWMGMNVP